MCAHIDIAYMCNAYTTCSEKSWILDQASHSQHRTCEHVPIFNNVLCLVFTSVYPFCTPQKNQRVTKDYSLELVIVDYESTDLNVEEELAKSSLPK